MLSIHHNRKAPYWLITVTRIMATVTCQRKRLAVFNCHVTSDGPMKPKIQGKSNSGIQKDATANKTKEGEKAGGEGEFDKEVIEKSNLLRRSAWDLCVLIHDRFFAILFLFVIIIINVVLIGIFPQFA